MLKYKFYHLIFRYLNPLIADNRFGVYLKWKTALCLIGTEFHQQNLKNNQDKLQKHFNGDTPLQKDLVGLLDIIHLSTNPDVLDIGAGPISKVGKVYRGKSIKLVAIDPLARRYNIILKRLNLKPPVATIYGVGESLSSKFSKDTFDLIHARNCIDHSQNPIKVIDEAIKVLKPGRYFYLNHYLEEGKAANYYGLHQWNFYTKNDHFFISGRNGEKLDVTNYIRPFASVESIETSFERIIVIIRKN